MDRPVIAFDVETTGRNPDVDQIIEISICLYDGSEEPRVYTRYVRPDVPITPGAQRVHGITMEDLADAPPFADCADEIEALFRSAEVVMGYNVSFDIRFLESEFTRIGRTFSLSGHTVVDPYRIWQTMEPRRLEHAYARFAGGSIENAHSAADDALAARAVLEGMRTAFGIEELSWEELAAMTQPDRDTWIGPSHHVRWEAGAVVLGFGKYEGQPFLDIARSRPDYLEWIQAKDFPAHVKSLCRGALSGIPDEEFVARIVQFYGPAPEPDPAPETGTAS